MELNCITLSRRINNDLRKSYFSKFSIPEGLTNLYPKKPQS